MGLIAVVQVKKKKKKQFLGNWAISLWPGSKRQIYFEAQLVFILNLVKILGWLIVKIWPSGTSSNKRFKKHVSAGPCVPLESNDVSTHKKNKKKMWVSTTGCQARSQ